MGVLGRGLLDGSRITIWGAGPWKYDEHLTVRLDALWRWEGVMTVLWLRLGLLERRAGQGRKKTVKYENGDKSGCGGGSKGGLFMHDTRIKATPPSRPNPSICPCRPLPPASSHRPNALQPNPAQTTFPF